jgi:hypothetical protein
MKRYLLFLILGSACMSVAPPSTAPVVAPFVAGPDDALLVGAGDIARCGTGQMWSKATGRIIAAMPDASVFTAGDDAYPDGSARDFADCYDPGWGSFNDRTFPSPGNHEHHTPGLTAYFDYYALFKRIGRTGNYSFDLKGWHIVSLDSDTNASPDVNAQAVWLETDLTKTDKTCIAAIWHHPLYSSGFHGAQHSDPGRKVGPLWRVLLAHRADVVINGHDHDYERFAPQDDAGHATPDGLREFVVGTGGGELRPFVKHTGNREFRDRSHFGVIVFDLHPGSYEWAFMTTDGTVLDRSAAPVSCH